MALTSSGTSDILGWNSTFPSVSIVGGGHHLLSFWLKPSTFTAGRYLTSNVSLSGTAELKIEGVRLTTNDSWITTGAGLAVGKWSFFCLVFAGVNASSNVQMRCWAGDADTRPTLLTTTPTAGSGTPLNSNLLVMNNQNNTGTSSAPAGNTAFQGTTDAWFAIGDVANPATTGAPDDTMGLDWGIGSTFTANDEQFLLDRYVTPLWFGQKPNINTSIASYPSYAQFFFESPDQISGVPSVSANMGLRRSSATIPTYAQGVTQSVGISSSDRCPRPMSHYDFPYRRR